MGATSIRLVVIASRLHCWQWGDISVKEASCSRQAPPPLLLMLLHLLVLLYPPGGGSSLLVDLYSSGPDTNEDAGEFGCKNFIMNPELAMAAMGQENDDNDEQVFQDVLMKMAIAYHLKRKTRSRELSFTVIELTNMIKHSSIIVVKLLSLQSYLIIVVLLTPILLPPAWSKHYLPILARDRPPRRLWRILLQRLFFCGKTLHAVLAWHQLYLTRGPNLGVRCRSLPWPLYECTLSARQSWWQRETQKKL
jgi:hypothetical protein